MPISYQGALGNDFDFAGDAGLKCRRPEWRGVIAQFACLGPIFPSTERRCGGERACGWRLPLSTVCRLCGGAGKRLLYLFRCEIVYPVSFG